MTVQSYGQYYKTNYDHKALARVVNCDRKCNATTLSVPYDHNLQLCNFYSTEVGQTYIPIWQDTSTTCELRCFSSRNI